MAEFDWAGLVIVLAVIVGWVGLFFLILYLTDPKVVHKMELKNTEKRVRREHNRKTR